MYCLVEFSQQAALGRWFNYFHLADEVIGRQRGEVAYLGPHEAGFKAPHLPPLRSLPCHCHKRPRGPIRLSHHFQDLRSAKGAEAEWSCKTMCPGWEWRCQCHSARSSIPQPAHVSSQPRYLGTVGPSVSQASPRSPQGSSLLPDPSALPLRHHLSTSALLLPQLPQEASSLRQRQASMATVVSTCLPRSQLSGWPFLRILPHGCETSRVTQLKILLRRWGGRGSEKGSDLLKVTLHEGLGQTSW